MAQLQLHRRQPNQLGAHNDNQPPPVGPHPGFGSTNSPGGLINSSRAISRPAARTSAQWAGRRSQRRADWRSLVGRRLGATQINYRSSRAFVRRAPARPLTRPVGRPSRAGARSAPDRSRSDKQISRTHARLNSFLGERACISRLESARADCGRLAVGRAQLKLRQLQTRPSPRRLNCPAGNFVDQLTFYFQPRAQVKASGPKQTGSAGVR